jgi:TNF receptor-associated factor 3
VTIIIGTSKIWHTTLVVELSKTIPNIQWNSWVLFSPGGTLSLYSQPFYTSRYGYKLCARVYLNGDGAGKNSHVSFFLVVMQGDYDDLLTWPFKQRVTLCLLDQRTQRNNMADTFRPDPTSTSFQVRLGGASVAAES